jgi:hypothetical protein
MVGAPRQLRDRRAASDQETKELPVPTETMNTPDYLAALHLLACPLLEGRTAPYIGENEIDWEGIYARLYPLLSRSERLLVDAAYNLFGGEGALSLRELVTVLDGENFNTICEAILGLRRLLAGCEF